MRTSPPKVTTLLVALVLWIVGALELLGGLDLPHHAGQWALLLCGALLMVASQVRGL